MCSPWPILYIHSQILCPSAQGSNSSRNLITCSNTSWFNFKHKPTTECFFFSKLIFKRLRCNPLKNINVLPFYSKKSCLMTITSINATQGNKDLRHNLNPSQHDFLCTKWYLSSVLNNAFLDFVFSAKESTKVQKLQRFIQRDTKNAKSLSFILMKRKWKITVKAKHWSRGTQL